MWLLDTGILLRLLDTVDPRRRAVQAAVTRLLERDEVLCCGVQNIAEFWNVSTRPATARGGFGLTLEETRGRLEAVQENVEVIFESAVTFAIWKDLIVRHRVSGVQVHDARLVALMATHAIVDLLTLNPGDFHRYPDIRVHTPADVVATNEPEK